MSLEGFQCRTFLYDVIVVGGGPSGSTTAGAGPARRACGRLSSARSFRAKNLRRFRRTCRPENLGGHGRSGSLASVVAFADDFDPDLFWSRALAFVAPFLTTRPNMDPAARLHRAARHSRLAIFCSGPSGSRLGSMMAARLARIRREDRWILVDVAVAEVGRLA